METSQIDKLIIKFFTKSISKEEWNELNRWFEKSKDDKVFLKYLEINYAIEDIMSEFNTEKTKQAILKKIKKDKRTLNAVKVMRVFKYAAVITILFGVGYFYQQSVFTDNSKEFVLPNQNTITLELESGNLEVISEGDASEIVNEEGIVIGSQKGNRLIYSGASSQVKLDKVVYNQLTVPYGKRFELELSDGTIAYLNAGTSIKYPIQFLEGQDRAVFLVGEAFLEVTKDSNRPFIVNTSNNMDVKVFGTKFNVSNYPEDEITEVVLVEGSVGLQVDSKTKTILEPGYMGSFHREHKNIIEKPVITSVYTSWMQGDIVFRNMTFTNILKKLERQYNFTIENQNLTFSEKRFNANFGDEPIEIILNYFKNTYQINYTIKDNHVIIH